jgi:hypothetical protein
MDAGVNIPAATLCCAIHNGSLQEGIVQARRVRAVLFVI